MDGAEGKGIDSQDPAPRLVCGTLPPAPQRGLLLPRAPHPEQGCLVSVFVF